MSIFPMERGHGMTVAWKPVRNGVCALCVKAWGNRTGSLSVYEMLVFDGHLVASRMGRLNLPPALFGQRCVGPNDQLESW